MIRTHKTYKTVSKFVHNFLGFILLTDAQIVGRHLILIPSVSWITNPTLHSAGRLTAAITSNHLIALLIHKSF